MLTCLQAFKDAAYGHGFTADIDGKGAKKSPAKRKAAELNDVEQQVADEVRHRVTAWLMSFPGAAAAS